MQNQSRLHVYNEYIKLDYIRISYMLIWKTPLFLVILCYKIALLMSFQQKKIWEKNIHYDLYRNIIHPQNSWIHIELVFVISSKNSFLLWVSCFIHSMQPQRYSIAPLRTFYGFNICICPSHGKTRLTTTTLLDASNTWITGSS